MEQAGDVTEGYNGGAKTHEQRTAVKWKDEKGPDTFLKKEGGVGEGCWQTQGRRKTKNSHRTKKNGRKGKTLLTIGPQTKKTVPGSIKTRNRELDKPEGKRSRE